jgi:hypothetical protein
MLTQKTLLAAQLPPELDSLQDLRHFTCFTSTKVQILTQKTLLAAQLPPELDSLQDLRHFTCFTSTKVQILTQKTLLAAQGLRSIRQRVAHLLESTYEAYYYCFTSTRVRIRLYSSARGAPPRAHMKLTTTALLVQGFSFFFSHKKNLSAWRTSSSTYEVYYYCFTSTRVRKRTLTPLPGRAFGYASAWRSCLLALLAQKCKN